MTMQVDPLTTPDQYTKCHHTVNDAFIDDHHVNVTYDELLRHDDDEFASWLEAVRKKILAFWDDGTPPRMGLSDYDINAAIGRLDAADISKIWVKCDDGLDGLQAPASSHGFIAQWFPTMMKTRINYSEKDIGISVYDMFANDKLWGRYAKSYAFRHFRRDSFFAYTRSIHTHEEVPTLPGVVPKTAIEYMERLRDNPTDSDAVPTFDDVVRQKSYGLLLTPLDNADKQDYTGYSTKMKAADRSVWWITAADAIRLRDSGEFPGHWFRAVKDGDKKSHYILRLYDSEKRIFPDGFRPFRISMAQYAVNWPSLAAKAIYEKFTAGIDHPVIWDPSSGWGGRLFGAITSKNHPLYIGTDPNEDHLWTDENGDRHSKYTELAAYYADLHPLEPRAPVLFFPCGSEVMHEQPEFQKYKGKIHIVLTSCPYFLKEVYSEDSTQSAKKYPQFEDWCELFLKPTLQTAAAWLIPGGHLFWNIADAKFGNKMYPLEAKSIEYATSFGLLQKETIRLLMTNMPGANRIDANGKGTAKNTTTVNGRLQKFEPIFHFVRPS